MLDEIRKDLADNYNPEDDDLLQSIIDEVTMSALSISNRDETVENKKLLYSEIKHCVKSLYLQRGTEGSNSYSDGGKSTSFNDPFEELRRNIVNSGKRRVF